MQADFSIIAKDSNSQDSDSRSSLHLCAVCERESSTRICSRCESLISSQSIFHQRAWQTWTPHSRKRS